MPLRTLDRNGIGTIWTQVQALRYAVNHGASVINLSYSFDLPSLVLADVLSRLTCSRGAEIQCQSPTRPGVVVVSAAGNSGLSYREYPAADSAPGLLAVGATTNTDVLAAFSNYGSWVPLAAPGEDILSTIPGGGYATWSGTSMAAPLAAGTVALVRSLYPALRPSEAVVQVKTTAAPMSAKIRRRVDAASALSLVSQ
jgi:subtilisin family serine protease